MPSLCSRHFTEGLSGPSRYIDFDGRARHRPCSGLSPDKLLAHHIELSSFSYEGTHRDGLRLVRPNHADVIVGVVAPAQKHSAGIKQRLSRSAADQLVGVP